MLTFEDNPSEPEKRNLFFTFSNFMPMDTPATSLPVSQKDYRVIDGKNMVRAKLFALQDQAERLHKKAKVTTVLLSPSVDAKFWVLTFLFTGGMTLNITYDSFLEADAYLESQNYFGLKNTKYFENIYASWDN